MVAGGPEERRSRGLYELLVSFCMAFGFIAGGQQGQLAIACGVPLAFALDPVTDPPGAGVLAECSFAWMEGSPVERWTIPEVPWEFEVGPESEKCGRGRPVVAGAGTLFAFAVRVGRPRTPARANRASSVGTRCVGELRPSTLWNLLEAPAAQV